MEQGRDDRECVARMGDRPKERRVISIGTEKAKYIMMKDTVNEVEEVEDDMDTRPVLPRNEVERLIATFESLGVTLDDQDEWSHQFAPECDDYALYTRLTECAEKIRLLAVDLKWSFADILQESGRIREEAEKLQRSKSARQAAETRKRRQAEAVTIARFHSLVPTLGRWDVLFYAKIADDLIRQHGDDHDEAAKLFADEVRARYDRYDGEPDPDGGDHFKAYHDAAFEIFTAQWNATDDEAAA